MSAAAEVDRRARRRGMGRLRDRGEQGADLYYRLVRRLSRYERELSSERPRGAASGGAAAPGRVPRVRRAWCPADPDDGFGAAAMRAHDEILTRWGNTLIG